MQTLEAPASPEISQAELIKLCAVDTELYARTFFPKTFRQKSPSFANKIWHPLENPRYRKVNIIAYRESAKTTRLRVFTSKRIAYGISRTVLYIGVSERDAIISLRWLKKNVETNTFWAQTFGLQPGNKWEETQIEVYNTITKQATWVLAAGITGSLRGLNFDDYRPDLIIVDDPQTDEMASSEEQREKVDTLLMGAVANSLAPVVDEPNAKLVMAATPQHKQDVTQQALKDPDWFSIVIPCWTDETLNSPVSKQESAWPERIPSEDLRKEKRGALRKNKLSVFIREKECRVTTPETSQFKLPWLNVRPEDQPTPRGCFAVLAIDPVPPPSDKAVAKGLKDLDFEAHYVWGRYNGDYHLLDCARSRGHNPSWSIASALSLAHRWRVARIVVETVAYQKTLKWLLEREMRRRGIYFSVVAFDDKRSKFTRIVSTLSGLATHGKLWIGQEHTEFAEQFESYPNVDHDDDLDASAIALSDLANPFLEGDSPAASDDRVEELEVVRSAP